MIREKPFRVKFPALLSKQKRKEKKNDLYLNIYLTEIKCVCASKWKKSWIFEKIKTSVVSWRNKIIFTINDVGEVFNEDAINLNQINF